MAPQWKSIGSVAPADNSRPCLQRLKPLGSVFDSIYQVWAGRSRMTVQNARPRLGPDIIMYLSDNRPNDFSRLPTSGNHKPWPGHYCRLEKLHAYSSAALVYIILISERIEVGHLQTPSFPWSESFGLSPWEAPHAKGEEHTSGYLYHFLVFDEMTGLLCFVRNH